MQKNVSGNERFVSVLLGGVALLSALRATPVSQRKKILGMTALGLLWRGTTGSCLVYKTLNFSSAKPKYNASTSGGLESSVLINKPLGDVSQFFEDNDKTFTQGPGANEFRSKEASGRWALKLTEAKGGTQTRLAAVATGIPTDAFRTRTIWRASQAAMKHAVAAELRNIKAMIETGVIPTIDGQAHGQRGALGSVATEFMQGLHKRLETMADLPIQPPPKMSMPTASARQEVHA